MKNGKDAYADLRSMIADYMEDGFLENIIDMFRRDGELYSLIGDLIKDERVRVRIGVTALLEELRKSDSGNISRALDTLLPLLHHDNPVVRGDAANLLGIIGDRSAVQHLEKSLHDDNENVRIISEEAIRDIKSDFFK